MGQGRHCRLCRHRRRAAGAADDRLRIDSPRTGHSEKLCCVGGHPLDHQHRSEHDQWQRWIPHLEHVAMPLGQVLYEPGSALSHVYFPTTAIVSLLYVMQNGESAEIAVVGN